MIRKLSCRDYFFQAQLLSIEENGPVLPAVPHFAGLVAVFFNYSVLKLFTGLAMAALMD